MVLVALSHVRWAAKFRAPDVVFALELGLITSLFLGRRKVFATKTTSATRWFLGSEHDSVTDQHPFLRRALR